MSVAILLVTHKNIGNDMLKVVASILNEDFSNTACIEIPMDSNIEKVKQQITSTLDTLFTDQGVLILTDCYGSTPCNIAAMFVDHNKRALVSGLNLPMLIRVMNYRSLPLYELKHAAVVGGSRGITSKPE